MKAIERPLVLRATGCRLVAILHEPAQPGPRGVLIVVGGPQYRVGSHRQFVSLARHLAERGVPVLRFDYRGMGDSEGDAIGFEGTAPDLAAALDCLTRETKVASVVVWGLCDAASAALLHAVRDERVVGIVLANPWVRREQSEARAYLKHYYWARVTDLDQWRRLATGKVRVLEGVRDVARFLVRRFSASAVDTSAHAGDFVAGMLAGLESFRGKTLLILSGDDLTAAEFKDEAARSVRWSAALKRPTVTRRDFPEANHTFSRDEWRTQVAVWTEQWMATL
ncbi:MAG TPA: hydrolase 1, exosortase A system-associated [Gammaproteobacteria bacterium]|nr:hydrolase 1, exosortase A system-associated [Gammaproteobacteria bacterium]